MEARNVPYPTLLFISLLLFSLPTLTYPQCTTDQTADFTVGPIGGNNSDTIARSKILPSFGFEMLNDSCRTMYRLSDVKKNDTAVTLYGWCGGQDINDWEANKLSDSTRTNSFVVFTGDTISFYRELAWYNPFTNEQRAGNYSAKDTLDYAVELVRSSTNERLALLDSIGILRRTTVGTPVLYGTRPIIAIATYAVPSNLNNESVRIRVRVTSRGNGDHYFVRTDRFGLALSDRVNEQEWQDYLDEMGGNLGKKNILFSNTHLLSNTPTVLTITPNPTNEKIEVKFSSSLPSKGTLAITITDSDGRLIFIPYSSNSFTSAASLNYCFQNSGTYYVSLIENGIPTAVEKIIVSK